MVGSAVPEKGCWRPGPEGWGLGSLSRSRVAVGQGKELPGCAAMGKGGWQEVGGLPCVGTKRGIPSSRAAFPMFWGW